MEHRRKNININIIKKKKEKLKMKIAEKREVLKQIKNENNTLHLFQLDEKLCII